ncbi:MAG: outer-membrane lipoprotein carrier protein LolA [Endomicrobium sp.]|nr:outer-membrane lipoprotein carrier protein LolA [Endomicrobium sp.]
MTINIERNSLPRSHMFIVKVMVVVLLIIILAFSRIVYARVHDNKIDVFLEKIEKTNRNVNTISTDYVQSIFFESKKEEQKICGKLFFKKNYGIYIDQKVPQEQQIYFDGKNITIYIPKNRQVIIDNWNSIINENFTFTSILGFMGVYYGDLKRMNKTNIVNFVDENEKYILVKVNLKSCDMKICISKLSMHPEKIILDLGGVIMKIVLKNYIINSVLDNNIFRFSNMNNDIEMIKLN